MKLYKLGFVLTSLLLSSQSFGGSFDDNRKGLIFGLGIGVGQRAIDESLPFSGDYVSRGITTSFRIGGGITETFSLFYLRNALWHNSGGYTWAEGISGLGLSYFFKPNTYVLGAVGLGDVMTPLETGDDTISETGSAYLLGVGFEVSPHVQVETSILNSDVDNIETSALHLTLNYVWY